MSLVLGEPPKMAVVLLGVLEASKKGHPQKQDTYFPFEQVFGWLQVVASLASLIALQAFLPT